MAVWGSNQCNCGLSQDIVAPNITNLYVDLINAEWGSHGMQGSNKDVFLNDCEYDIG